MGDRPGVCQHCYPEAVPVEAVDHPAHYGGSENPYEAIKVIEAWDLDFCLGNTVKYISRAGKKDKAKEIEDLKKAAWYLARRLEQLEGVTTIKWFTGKADPSRDRSTTDR
jgi:hypothetical protein